METKQGLGVLLAFPASPLWQTGRGSYPQSSLPLLRRGRLQGRAGRWNLGVGVGVGEWMRARVAWRCRPKRSERQRGRVEEAGGREEGVRGRRHAVHGCQVGTLSTRAPRRRRRRNRTRLVSRLGFFLFKQLSFSFFAKS